MTSTIDGKFIRALFAAYAIAILFPGPARAEITDIADVPLANSPSTAVLPNLMYILDDSGSMQWDYMPDNIHTLTTGTQIKNCKTTAAGAAQIATVQCANAPEPPYFANGFNQIYYNPDITYSPPTDYLGVSFGNMSPTAAKFDGFVNPAVANLTTTYPETYYCATPNAASFTGSIAGNTLTVTAVASGNILLGMTLTGGTLSGGTTITVFGTGAGGVGTYTVTPAQGRASTAITGTLGSFAAQLGNPAVCVRNGIDNIQAAPNNYFLYWSNNTTAGTPKGAYPVDTGTPATSFNNQVVSNTGNPYYFTITPDEYCTDRTLVQCTNSTVPVGAFVVPAPVRYCATKPNAAALSPVSDPAGTVNPKCRQKFNSGSYVYPRYGRYTRVDIMPATPLYPKGPTSVRTECVAAAFCTYAEEVQNFANWYSYYRIRMTMMKTITGHAFLSIDDRYRVGFITINPGSPVVASRYLPIAKYNAAQKSSWYTKLYAMGSNGSTPLRQALSRVGRHYAGVTTGINNGMPQDPIQYACQQNFALLTTDGYYNDAAGSTQDVNGANVGNQDNVANASPPFFVSRGTGTLDGSGTQVLVTTPTTITAQNICTGNANTAFPGGGTQTPCGCVGANKRIMQRVQTGTTTSTIVDGVPAGVGSTVTSTAFSNITACTVPLIVTTVTPITETQQNVCQKNNTTTFTAGTANNAGSQTACGCVTTNPAQYNKKLRTTTYNQTVVTTDGVVTSNTKSNILTQTYANVGAVCSLVVPSVTLAPNPTALAGAATITNNGGTTLSIAAFNPNPQTAVTGAPTSATTNGGTADTLADVAMYYYKNDLRPVPPWSALIGADDVPTTVNDIQPAQHMVTFTLGLGLQGLMDYVANYATSPTGDYANIVAGTPGACPWTVAGAQCNWPVPVAASPSALDDLWHAAVNGRGIYYSASDPNSLADGLGNALTALHVATASASASATSSPNITQTNNFIFSSTFRTVKWDGEIVAQRIDPTTGNILPAIEWSAQGGLDARTAAATDTRTIYTFTSVGATKLKSFLYANLTSAPTGSLAAEQPYFQNQGLALSQFSLLSAANKVIANNGTSLVNFLRGQRGDETTVFRLRDHVLGDPVNATPTYVQAPTQSFVDAVTPSYAVFKSANAGRTPVIYIAANDGMLHAFNGGTAANGGGTELWAYVPRMVLPVLKNLATDNWDVQHKFIVDGSPVTMDVFDSANSVWKTVLVAGLNKGGRGYYALDVTDPANPKGLWEVCSDNTLCSTSDTDIGNTYGPPVITKRAYDGKWVVIVTSGYDNVAPGTGQGYLYVLDAMSGAILQKISAQDGATLWGTTTTPSGLSKIAAFATSFSADNTGLFVYGGDLYGNAWRFDMSVAPVAYPAVQTTGVQKLGQLLDGSTPAKPQSITARPEIGVINGNRVLFFGTGRYLGLSDLVDPATLSPAEQWAYQQSLYAFKDKGTNYGSLRTVPTMVQQTLTDTAGIRTISTNPVSWTTNDGWWLDFNPANTSPGERMNLDPQLQLSTLLVLTNVPNNGACSVGGDSFPYQFNYLNGFAIASSPGLAVAQKITGQIAVGFVVIRLPSGSLKQIITGASGTKTTSAVYTGGSGSAARRVSWRELVQ